MQQRKGRSAARTLSASRPGSCSLVLHILRGAFTDGMLFPALLCIGLTVVLYTEKLPYHSAISALLISSLVLMGLLKGCASWQQELQDYRRQLAMQRYQEQQAEADRGHSIPGFIPFTPR